MIANYNENDVAAIHFHEVLELVILIKTAKIQLFSNSSL